MPEEPKLFQPHLCDLPNSGLQDASEPSIHPLIAASATVWWQPHDLKWEAPHWAQPTPEMCEIRIIWLLFLHTAQFWGDLLQINRKLDIGWGYKIWKAEFMPSVSDEAMRPFVPVFYCAPCFLHLHLSAAEISVAQDSSALHNFSFDSCGSGFGFELLPSPNGPKLWFTWFRSSVEWTWSPHHGLWDRFPGWDASRWSIVAESCVWEYQCGSKDAGRIKIF